MAIRFKCPHCQKGLSAKETLAGKKVACAACKKAVLVPAPKPQPSQGGPGVAEAPPHASDPTHVNGMNGTSPPVDADAEALSAFNDEPAKEEEPQEPRFIEFECNFCGEKVSFPVEMGGKQGQCPNEDCKRIVKIPLPKKVEKKDWRKVNTRNIGLLDNQPEQMEGAWGTEEKRKAGNKSLEEAGAIKKPPKPGVGITGWINRVLLGVGIVFAAGFAIWALSKLKVEGDTKSTFADFKKYLDAPKDAKAEAFKPLPPILQAEIHRVIGLMHLKTVGMRQKALESFLGARSLLAGGAPAKTVAVDSDLFLLELALAQLQLGGAGADILTKSRFNWKEEVLEEVQKTLKTIKSPDVRQMALRDVTTQLLNRNQNEVALSLAGAMVNQAVIEGSKRPAILAQQIALQYRLDQKDLEKQYKIPDPAKEAVADAVTRSGYAEGFARKGMFKEALDLAAAKGTSRDRLEAALGAAAIAFDDPKTRSEAAPLLQAAFDAAKEPQKEVQPWQALKLHELGLRSDMADAAKELSAKMRPEFKQRAQLDTFLARCAKATGPVSSDDFSELEATDKEGTTLALAWHALARHNARVAGRSVNDIKESLEARQVVMSPEQLDRARPMAHAGAVLGELERRR